jgi:type I restriction enzyme S subunit
MKTKQTLVPELRFYNDKGNPYPDWEEKKLGKVARFLKGKGISKAEVAENGATPCVRYGELYTHYNELITVTKSFTNIDNDDLELSQGNDVIIPASGETHIDIATASCVKEKGIALGGDLNIIRSEQNGVFMAYYMNGSLRINIARLAQGSSVIHLYATQLKDLNMHLPPLPEQEKIAAFLTSVDDRIDQLKRKKSLLQDYKKGVMQKLFSQELRFKDDHGNDFPDWESKEFDLIVSKSSKKHDPAKMTVNYPCVELESLSQETGQLLETFSSAEQKSIKSKFSEGQVLFGKLRPYLKKFLHAEFEGVCSSEIWVFDGVETSNPFLYHLIQTHKFNQAANVSSGSKMPRSDWSYLSEIPFSYPTDPDEQAKIANFLTALDQKIEQIDTQITQTQTFKKGLLQQMFV